MSQNSTDKWLYQIIKSKENFVGEALCDVNILETFLQPMARIIQIAIKARLISVIWTESKELYEVSMRRKICESSWPWWRTTAQI
jgi:hypothetical protein